MGLPSAGARFAGRFILRVRLALPSLLALPLFLFTTGLVAPALLGQSDSAYSDNSEKKYTVSGTVVNAVTGEPVPRALVELAGGAGQRSALTNAEGHFDFSGLPATQGISLGAQKPGYFNEEQLRHKMPTTVTVGPDTPSLVVKLVPEGVIAGRITANGEPVEDVPVRVVAPDVQDGRKQWAPAGGATSDEEGEFRIAGLQPGGYYLEVGPKAPEFEVAAPGRPVSGYRRVFYPNAPEVEGATPLVLGMGQRVEADVSLKLEPWYRVSGVVRGADPALNFNLRLVGAGDGAEGFQLNRGTGEFETRVPAGNYRLEVRGFGPQGMTASADVPVAVNSDVKGLQVALGPAPVIPIDVKMEAASGSGGSGMRLRGWRGVNGTPPPVSIWLRPGSFFEGGGMPMVSPDATGKPETIAVRNLVPGSYWVEIGKNSPSYVQSAQCGNIDLLRERLTLTADPPCGGIEIVVRDDGATLNASGTWEGDPAQAMMVLLPERAPQQAVVMPVAKGAEAQFGELAPGTYSVVLVDSVDGLEYKDPEAMSAYLSKAAHVTLSPNQKMNVTVELVHVGR